MKLAVVIPRYAPGALGGAEAHGAAYAKRLQSAGHEVELLTTCARSHATWENELPEGESIEDGLTVRRFAVQRGDADRFASTEWRIVHRIHTTHDEQVEWIRYKGYAPGLCDYLHDSDHDRVILMPYSCATTYFGTLAVPGKAVVHTLLHDEPYARLAVTEEIVRAARAILFNSPPETALARRLFGELPCHGLGGMGFEPFTASPDLARFRARYRLGSGPLVLYAGRWEGGKGVPRLVDYMNTAARRGHDWILALIGSGPDAPQNRRGNIVPVGFVDEFEKHSAFASADIFCQPSQNESLSIVLMEAWLAGSPALVNGECAVTRYHCRQSGGGLWFTSYPEFEAAIELLLSNKRRANAMAAGGKRYVLEIYSWDAVLERVTAVLEAA